MRSRPKVSDFFRFQSEYLSIPKAIFAFWGSLIGGIVSLALALWLHGTRWEVVCAAVGVFYLVDACLVRYLFEVKREITQVKDRLNAVDEDFVQ
jgi:hypothetical protein